MATSIEIATKDIIFDDGRLMKLVEFTGQLDESNVDATAPTLYTLIEESPNGTSFIYDFANLTYLNSKSIGYLSDWYQRIFSKGGTLVIARARENIIDILRTVGLDHLIKLYFTLDEAKLALATAKSM